LEFTIEIGTAEQKNLIICDIQPIFEAISRTEPELIIERVVVPMDFDQTVNSLSHSSTYQSVRIVGDWCVAAEAKVIETEAGWTVVLSPRLFSDQHDFKTRCFVYVHELEHLIIRQRLAAIAGLPQSDACYMQGLQTLLDEYMADRLAYTVVEEHYPERSNLWESMLQDQAKYLLGLLLDDSIHRKIKESRLSVESHKDVTRFLDEVQPVYDAIIAVLAHLFALHDQHPELVQQSQIELSPFVHQSTLSLVDYIRAKHMDKDYDLSNGLEIFKEFLSDCFGFELKDSGQGLICHVSFD